MATTAPLAISETQLQSLITTAAQSLSLKNLAITASNGEKTLAKFAVSLAGQ
jgi:hypothetical protein